MKAIVLRLIESRIQTFEEYNDHVEHSLLNEIDKISGRSDELTSDQQEDYFDWYYDDITNMRDVFPHLLRCSLFTTVYAFLEHELDVLCERYKHEKQLSSDVSNSRDKGIERSRTYLKKVVCLPFPDQTSEWERIKKYRCLRNHMAHAGGMWRQVEDDNLKKKLRLLPNITIDDMSRISLGKNFVKGVLSDVRWLLTQIINLT